MGIFNIDLKGFSILIIEDALEYKQLISESLGRSPSHKYVSTLKEAKQEITSNTEYDCILLDLSLPDGNGYDLMRDLANSQTPVIVLTASNEISNKVVGLSMGVQDYISKPFDSLELAARIKNKIDLANRQKEGVPNKILGNLHIDLAKRLVSISNTGKSIELTRKEFECLLVFSENKDIVLTRESLLNKVWGQDNFVMERSVDSTIVGLRKKLSEWDHELRSIYGVGYQLSLKKTTAQNTTNATAEPSDKLLSIFVKESEQQLHELKEYSYLGEWDRSVKLVHKLKGSFAIFTNELDSIGNEIESIHQKGLNTSILVTKFIELATELRQKILDGRERSAS